MNDFSDEHLTPNYNAPSPQADELKIVTETLEGIVRGGWSSEKWCDYYGYDKRQYGYYINANRWLGFIQGTPNYAMHLALNYENKPYLGVVLIPEREELWFADSKNVWCEDKNGLQKKVDFHPKKSLNEMTLVISKNHKENTLENLINKIGFKRVTVMGSIGCKIASIIRGECDIYISLSLPGKSSPKDWDFAAPETILRGAGGSITNLENEELSYGKLNFKQEGIIIASNNKHKHKSICLQIKQIIKRYDLCPFYT